MCVFYQQMENVQLNSDSEDEDALIEKRRQRRLQIVHKYEEKERQGLVPGLSILYIV